jgi:hypothetical protein
MSQVTINNLEPETQVSYNITNNTAESIQSNSASLPSSPILILQDRVRIFGELITTNVYYPFEYKGKKYLLYRPKKNVTEIYNIRK